jgi:hypothetical protein
MEEPGDTTGTDQPEGRKGVRSMLVRWLLFETSFGRWLVAGLEKWAGLALVDAGWLGRLASGVPAAGEGE